MITQRREDAKKYQALPFASRRLCVKHELIAELGENRLLTNACVQPVRGVDLLVSAMLPRTRLQRIVIWGYDPAVLVAIVPAGHAARKMRGKF